MKRRNRIMKKLVAGIAAAYVLLSAGASWAKAGDGFTERRGEYTEGKAVSVTNLILNSSFDITSYPGHPDCWWPRNWVQLRDDGMGKTHPDEPLSFFGLDSENPYHGKYCLKFGPNMGRGVWRKPFWINGGKTYTFSAYMRTDVPGTKGSITASRCGVKPGVFELTTKWQRYHFTATPNRQFLLVLNNQGPGHVYIDAIQMEEGSELHPYVQDNYKPFVY